MNKLVSNTNTIQPEYCHSVWILSDNRRRLILALILSVTTFIIFKLFYPYSDFFSDSYSYIFAASSHLKVNIWPIGYSAFLSLAHYITHSDTFLVGIQYFSIQLATLHLYFTILYFLKPNKITQNVLFYFFFINPLTLYISNTINSDALFAFLSIMWITSLIFIVFKPSKYQVIIHAILLSLCFTVRNNAYYYPLVSAICFLLSPQPYSRKIVGILMPFLFLIPFILFTRSASYKMTGTRQYSLFTGWQLANNALYIYDQIKVDSTILLTPEAREVNTIASQFFSRVNPDSYRSYLQSYVGNFFIRQPEAPLKQYFSLHYHPRNEVELVASWGKASETFQQFGEPILLHHPVAYLKYFIYPNLWNYLIPPLSHLGRFNYGQSSIEPIAQVWFNYPHPKIHASSYTFQGSFLIIYQGLFLVINLFYIWQIVLLFLRKPFNAAIARPHILIFTFFLLNLIFSLAATTNILRYQFVPMFIMLTFGLTLSDYLESSRNKNKFTIKETAHSF